MDPFNLKLGWKIVLCWAAHGRYQEAMELLRQFELLPIT